MPKPWVFIANLGFEANSVILCNFAGNLLLCYRLPSYSHLTSRKRQEIVQFVVTDLVYKKCAFFVKQKLGWHQKPVRTRDLNVKTLDFVTENLGLVPKTSGLLQTLCFIKPMTNPWFTHDNPWKKTRVDTSKTVQMFCFFCEMFVSTTSHLQLGRTNLRNRKPGIWERNWSGVCAGAFLANPGFASETPGFEWNPTCFSGFEGQGIYIYMIIYNENKQQTGYPENPLGTTDMQKLVSAKRTFDLSQSERQQRVIGPNLDGWKPLLLTTELYHT